MKILILCLPGIGDALMATPIVNILRQAYPLARIDVATMFDSVSYIFKHNPHIQHVYHLPLYKQEKLIGIKSILSLRKEKYDVSILSFPTFRREYHIVQWLIGAKKRIGHVFPKGHWSECNFLDTDHIPVDEGEHNVINNLNLLEGVGIDWKNKIGKEKLHYEFILDQKDSTFGKEYVKNLHLEKSDIVAMHPGSIDSKAGVLKRWSIDRFAKIAKYLIQKKKKILIFIGPFEKELGEELYRLIDNKENCFLIKDMNFAHAVGILSNVKLLIANDNGFAHIANALKIPSIVLFGPTNSIWCGPYDSDFVTIVRKAMFSPWFRNDMKVTNPPSNAQSGMEKISVDDVILAMSPYIK